jgi:hypothetical protein
MMCIWCLNDFPKLSLEHGIPEALGCPPDLELRDTTCAGCNNRLGTVDQALLKSFEAISVMYGVPRKKGRPPTIDSWRAISSEHRPGGPHIFINGGPGIVDAKGKKLYPAAKSNGITDLWMKPDEGKLGFSMEFGNDPRFLPALYKIGLNLVARNYGAAAAARPDYDHIRAFVGQDKSAPGLTAVLATEVIPSAVTHASGPIIKPGRPYPMFRITILGVTLIIDLAPDQPGLRDMRGAATIMGESLYVFPTKRAA